ncbi:MAG: hypothetical protein VX589_10415 [Myxococcota bacterium]|nr:hypothetical protein [Myxococcota bacterium]
MLLLAAPAAADEYRAEEFRYGDQALGTGGALIARPTTPMATYYNPAGLAFQERSAVSGSIHFFGQEKIVLRHGLRLDGQAPKDLNSDADIALPSSSVVTLRINAHHRVAFSTYLISNTNQTFQNAFRSEETDQDGTTHDALSSLTRLVQDRQTWMGPSYAFALSRHWGIGLSLFYARRTMYWQTDTRWQDEQNSGDETIRAVFADIQSVTAVKDGRLLLRLGSSWQPTERMVIGLILTTQSVWLHGRAKLTAAKLWSGDPDEADARMPFADNLEVETSARTSSPWGLSLGLQYAWPGWLAIGVAADVWTPLKYTRIQLDEIGGDDVDDIGEYVASTVQRDWLVNGKFGLEWLTFDSFPIRMGLYTNRSAAQPVPARTTRYVAPKVHIYGAALSVGYTGSDAGISIGVNYEHGQGHDVVENDIRESYTDEPNVRVARTHSKFVVFVAGALSFASKTAQRYFDERKKKKQ